MISEADTVKTRLLVISDTHGRQLEYEQEADVAIHCGDLTNESKLDEYRSVIKNLSSIKAPLKLIVPGNHDFSLDIPQFQRKIDQVRQQYADSKGKDFARKYGAPGDAHRLFEAASDAGIVLLDQQGLHIFTLTNGARLTVYASPYTPHAGGFWGFQYRFEEGHDFDIPERVDVVITHGPALGLLDYSKANPRAGCPDLLAAVERARPRLHCCGHIHESWGAQLVTWNDGSTDRHEKASGIREILPIASCRDLKLQMADSQEKAEVKKRMARRYSAEMCYKASHCEGDPHPLKHGEQTLFVNAAIEGAPGESALHYPWVVEIELPKARREHDKGIAANA